MSTELAFRRVRSPLGDNHFNLKRVFVESYWGKKFGIKRALRLLGLSFEGIHNRENDDARNIWKITKTMTDDNLTELINNTTMLT